METTDSFDEGRQMTLFPTRLREFEEKNNLVFQHYLSAKNSLRRNSESGPCFGDQYTRRASFAEELIDGDDEVLNAMRRIFRRSSIVDPTVQKVRKEVLETTLIPKIFGKLGQEYDTEELRKWIKGQDRHGSGVVDFDGYQRICVHFIKDPEAIERAKTEEFSFKNLMRKEEEEDEEEDQEEEQSQSPQSQSDSEEFSSVYE